MTRKLRKILNHTYFFSLHSISKNAVCINLLIHLQTELVNPGCNPHPAHDED